MEKPNKDRVLVRAIKELAEEMKVEAGFFCYNWLVRLQKNGVTKYIMGYDWELNSATAQQIAKDKSACYELLHASGIPAIAHRLFLGPQFQNYIGTQGCWAAMLQYAVEQGYPVVCKPNMGTGGNDVQRVFTPQQLEAAVHDLFARYRGICLCPFYEIATEYRIIVLGGELQLIYAKQKPRVLGNGKSSLAQLIAEQHDAIIPEEWLTPELDLARVLPPGEMLELSWKHNLGRGAKPLPVAEGELKNKLTTLAIQAAACINIEFASVDVADCSGELRVMEINSGIMAENFARESETHYEQIKDIYRRALQKMMKNK
jgi:glutathione synthase/RimK-type ligase-like ATP-grasp enzyme